MCTVDPRNEKVTIEEARKAAFITRGLREEMGGMILLTDEVIFRDSFFEDIYQSEGITKREFIEIIENLEITTFMQIGIKRAYTTLKVVDRVTEKSDQVVVRISDARPDLWRGGMLRLEWALTDLVELMSAKEKEEKNENE